MNPKPGYQELASVLEAALEQAQSGKGMERHAKDLPFAQQRMQTISELLDTERGMAFQAIKKLTEGLDLADPDAVERELLGTIVYTAGIIVRYRMQRSYGTPNPKLCISLENDNEQK